MLYVFAALFIIVGIELARRVSNKYVRFSDPDIIVLMFMGLTCLDLMFLSVTA